MIPNPKPTKAPLRRIVVASQLDPGEPHWSMKLTCGHYVLKPLPSGTIDSWRRMRCKECISE